MKSILFEACVESAAAAIAAQEGGAGRVELCDNLFEGGTTPSAGTIRVARAGLRIPMHVIIRPRGGDFVYSEQEMQVMLEDIAFCKAAGVDGVVIGVLTLEGRVDEDHTRQLIEAARPMSVTFHRAFDMCRDPWQALDTLIELGVNRILTSGQAPTVLEGSELIAALIQKADSRIGILPGGGITPANLSRIIRLCNPREIHMVAWGTVSSPMQFRQPDVFMGGTLRPPEYERWATDTQIVRRIVQSLQP